MGRMLLSFLLLVCSFCNAQVSEPFKDLRNYIRSQASPIPVDTTPYLDMVYNKGNHYLLPFYKAFTLEQKKLHRDTASWNELIAQAVSFTGDHKTVLEYEKASYEKLADSTRKEIALMSDFIHDVNYVDAKQVILSRAKKSRVVMINEAHDKPVTRAFTASLLEELYQQGFRYLAMEMLDNSLGKPVTRVNAATGYYSAEPIAAELIRRAIDIGYTVIPYEDTDMRHTVDQREYAQAKNIATFLAKKDSAAKILVHAGYGHIEEGARANERIPMAAYFKIITGIDPLTIDQTEMTEQSTNPYGALLYDYCVKRKPLTAPSIATKNGNPVDPFGFNLYDLHVIHPPTKYQNERALWSSMYGWRNEIPVSPAYRTLFLVQAYYEKEYVEANPGMAVPADQTYLYAANGIYYLYLHKGKYKLVFRDKAYTILGTKDIIVN